MNHYNVNILELEDQIIDNVLDLRVNTEPARALVILLMG